MSPEAQNKVFAIPSQNVEANVVHSFEEVWEALDPSVKDLFTSRTGLVKEAKLGRFRRSVKSVLDGDFSFMDVIKLSEGCIKNEGQIDIPYFKEFLQNKNDDEFI